MTEGEVGCEGERALLCWRDCLQSRATPYSAVRLYHPFIICMPEDVYVAHILEAKRAVELLRTAVDRIYGEGYGEAKAQTFGYLVLEKLAPEAMSAELRHYGERVEIVFPGFALVLHIAEIESEVFFHKSHRDAPHLAVTRSVVGGYHAGWHAVNLYDGGVVGRVKHIMACANLVGEEAYALFRRISDEHGGMESTGDEKRIGSGGLAE